MCLCAAVPAPAGAAAFSPPAPPSLPPRALRQPLPAVLTHVFSRAIMKPKEEIPDDKSPVSHFAWDFFGNLPFLCPQIARHRVTVLLICLCAAVPAPAGAAALSPGFSCRAASFHVPGPGREALSALPALLLRFIGGKGPDQVLLALAPPVVIPRQDPMDCVQVICQAQLRVLCLPQAFFTSSMVARR